MGSRTSHRTRDAAAAIARQYARELEGRRRRAARAPDREDVHQLRVAARRARAFLRLFRHEIPQDLGAAAVADLRWLAGRAGPARDLGVFLEEWVLPGVGDPDSGLGSLRRRVAAEERSLRRRVRAAARSPRGRRASLRLADLAPALLRTGDAALDGPIAQKVDPRLSRLRRRLARGAARFDALSDDERHRLRVTGKRLRYALAALRPYLSDAESLPDPGALAALQQVLGTLQDVRIAAAIVERLRPDPSDPTRVRALARLASRRAEAEDRFEEAWRGVAEAPGGDR